MSASNPHIQRTKAMSEKKIIEIMAAHTHDHTPFFTKKPWEAMTPLERNVYLRAEKAKIAKLKAVGYVIVPLDAFEYCKSLHIAAAEHDAALMSYVEEVARLRLVVEVLTRERDRATAAHEKAATKLITGEMP